MCGSFYKLHKATGFSQATISEIRRGKRDLPMEWVPVLAEICGIDATQAVADALCDRLPEGSRARAILGGVRAAGAVVMLLISIVLGLVQPSNSYARSAGSPEITSRNVNTLYIVECWQALTFLFFMARGKVFGWLVPRSRRGLPHATPRRGLGAVLAM